MKTPNRNTHAQNRIKDNDTLKTKTGRWPVVSSLGRSIHGAFAALALLALPAVGLAQSDATLASLVPSEGALTPDFNSAIFSYTASVPYATASVTVTPTATAPLATITVDGNPATSGFPYGPISLSVGANLITTVVVSQDTLFTNTYLLTVTRSPASTNATLSSLTTDADPLTPAFASGTFSYTVTVPYATTGITLTPTVVDPTATIAVDGNPVTSGSPYGPISLGVGATVINTAVTAEDLVTTLTYTLTVTRTAASTNADLSNLVLSAGTLTPTFDSNTLSYTASVPYPTPSMTVTPTAADALATIKVNSNAVSSGSASAPISLSPGANTITTEVTAEDASTKTYTLTVTVTVADPVAIPGGPYFVYAGGTLALNGNASLPSDGQTITDPSGYEWDLNPNDNGGVFNADVTGATPAAISEAVLKATYGMSLGGNTIKLRVTDSAPETSVTEATVNILPAVALVYEPFNYPGTLLNGVSGSTEVGLTGTWFAAAESKLGRNLAFGPLVTRGAGIGDLSNGQNRFGGSRTISASALKDKGLLNDGATLWFSVVVGYDTGGNVSNSRLGFSLANFNFSTGFNQYYIANDTPQVGSGLGLLLGGSGVGNGRVAATQFRDVSFGNTGYVLGSLSPVLYAAGQSGLIVGKITWGVGAANDTVELYNPSVDLLLTNAISTLSVAVDQSTFDTITWARGDKVVMDEIRCGGSYQAVIETGSAWDLNGDTAGAGGPTPSGTWNSDAIWNLAPDGTLVPIPWQAGGVAVFSAGNDATGAYTVTVDGTKDIGGLVVEDGTVTFSGGTALRLTKDTTMSVAPGLTASIATPLTEDGSIRQFGKAGAGTLILSGNNVAATNGMNLSAGVARFESPAAINGTARNVTIGSGGTMMFGSGFGAGNITNALLNRVAESASGAIAADNYASTDFDFSAAGLTNASLGAVGSVNYTGTLTPNGTTYRLGGGGGTLTMANANALTGANDLVVNGNVTLAQDNDYTGTTTIKASCTVTVLGASSSSGVFLNTPNTILILGNNASLGIGILTVVNSFAGPGTLACLGTVVTANPVTANTDFNFGGTGALTIGAVTVNANRTITNTNTTNVSTIGDIGSSGGVRTLTFSGNGDTTVAGVIGGGTGISSVTKNGTGTLTLSAANNYTTTTTVNGGVLRLNDANAIPGGIGAVGGTGGLTFNGGVIGLGAGDFNRPLNVAATPGAATFTGNGGWAAYGADRIVNLGGASDPITWATAGTGLNGRTLLLGAATATHTVNFQNPLDLGTATNTVQVANGGAVVDATLSGILSDSGGGSLTKTGTGTLQLTAANSYSGNTTISGGTLTLGSSGSIANTLLIDVRTNASFDVSAISGFTLGSGQTLMGNGTVIGAVTVNGTVSPGASVGTLTTGSQTWNRGATHIFELSSATNSAGMDRLNITGTLDVQATAGNKFNLRLVSMATANTPGLVPDFNGYFSYSWVCATASAGIFNFDASKFAIDASAFANAYPGTFSVGTNGNSLVVNYTAPPLVPPTLDSFGPLSGGSFPLTFSGPDGQLYTVLTSTNVALPISNWKVLESGVFGANPVIYNDGSATNAQQFYRIQSP